MNTGWGLREAARARSVNVDGIDAWGTDEGTYPKRGTEAALSAPGRAYADPLMAAQWCARLLSEPPNPRYSDKDKALIHECLVRNLSLLECLLDPSPLIAAEKTTSPEDEAVSLSRREASGSPVHQ